MTLPVQLRDCLQTLTAARSPLFCRWETRLSINYRYSTVPQTLGTRRRLESYTIAFIVIGANGIVRGEKVTSLARWPPNPSRCWAL